MSRDQYSDDCPDCRPAMMDAKTGRRLPDDSPEMTAVNRVWADTSPEARRAWHRFTCQGSRSIGDLALVKTFSDRVQAALDALPGRAP